MTKWNIKLMYKYCKDNNIDLPLINQKYINTKHKYKYICDSHGVYEQSWDNHKSGHSCPECKKERLSNLKFKYTTKSYKKLLIDKHLMITPIDNYKNYNTKIKHECLRCGYIFKAVPNNILVNKSGCPRCNNKLGLLNLFVFHICNILNLDMPLELHKYYKLAHRYSYKCKVCNFVYCSTLNDHFRKDNKRVSCPNCSIFNTSKGEKYICNYLDNHSIKYESQKKFSDLKDKTYLSYDFYLPDYNILIEYQGEQHYKAFDYFGGKEKFKKQQKHDKLKRNYAEKHGYKLLELKYTLDTQDLVNKFLYRNIDS